MADLVGLVELVARSLADDPDAVSVEEGERRGSRHLELQVAPGDIGRVIGRQGRTAAALRLLLATAAEQDGARVSLDIRDTSGRR
ncbi:MAG: KH domain-containing protein [Vicinamibacterales bacterium]